MNRKQVLGVLGTGFGLLILLLAAVAYLGFQKTVEIQANAAALVRAQLLDRNLLDALDREQRRMSDVMFRIFLRGSGRPLDADEVLREVESGASEIKRLAELGVDDAALWKQLTGASQDFAAAVRESLAQPPATIDEIEELLARHNRFVLLAGDLIKAGSEREARVEAAIEKQSRELAGRSGWLLAGCFLLAAACALLALKVTNDAFRRLEIQGAELARVSWHMLQGQEAAARRFSHEMHDELGQSLTGLKATLSMITPEEFAARRPDYTRLLEEAIRSVRELSQLLRPVILDDLGLDAGLRWLLERFQQRTGIETEYDSNLTGRLAEDTETQLFRIAQESLTNVARHAGATRVRASLRVDGASVRLLVEDNGRGLPAGTSSSKPSLGMIGMRARAHQAHGSLKVGVSDLGGVRIEVAVPYWHPDHDAESKDENLARR